MHSLKLYEEKKVMEVQENKLNDELLPEIEMALTPSKLSETVRVDIFRFSEEFVNYLVENNILDVPADGIPDTIEMPLSKLVNFCISVRDAYRKYKVAQNADV